MNWLLYLVIGILLIGAAAGYVRGAIRIAVSIAATVVTLLLVVVLTPYVSEGISNYTQLDEWIEEKCESGMAESMQQSWQQTTGNTDISGLSESEWKEKLQNIEIPKNLQTEIIENTHLPSVFKQFLEENNNKEAYTLIGADSFADYIGKGIARVVINSIAAIVIFLAASLIIRIFIYIFDVITMLPIIGGVNRIAGAAFGIILALVAVWILFLIVTLMYTTTMGKEMFEMIQENPFLSFLYKHNYIWNIITGLR